MIVRPRLHWLRMLFVIDGSVLPKIWLQLTVIAVLAAVVTSSDADLLRWKIELTFVPFTLIGIALAIFLGFRNTASYDRYWEARKLWGELLDASRALTRQYLLWVDKTEPSKDFVYRLIGFVHALRHQLRKTDPMPELASLLPADLLRRMPGAYSQPILILQSLGETAALAVRQGRLDPHLATTIDHSLDELTDAVGGCERISNTPIPFAYSVIVHRTIYIYCFLLPFGLVSSIGILTPLMVTFVAYTFLSLDALNEELEGPFGAMANDLPLEALSKGIEITLRELIGETDLPKLPQPQNYVLR